MIALVISFFMSSANADIHYDFTEKVNYSLIKSKDQATGKEIALHKYESPKTNEELFISVHGFLDNCGYLKDLHSFLFSNDFDVLCFDLPGHGLSEGAPGEVDSFSDYASMLQIIDFKELKKTYKKIHFIGHSTGTIGYLESMRQNFKPDFEKVILIAPLIRSNHWKWSMFAHSVFGGIISKIPRTTSNQERFLEIKKTDKNFIKYVPSNWVQALKEWNKELVNFPSEVFQDEIHVFFGTKDTVIDKKFNQFFYEKIFPNAKFYLIMNGTHHMDLDPINISRSLYSQIENIINID